MIRTALDISRSRLFAAGRQPRSCSSCTAERVFVCVCVQLLCGSVGRVEVAPDASRFTFDHNSLYLPLNVLVTANERVRGYIFCFMAFCLFLKQGNEPESSTYRRCIVRTECGRVRRESQTRVCTKEIRAGSGTLCYSARNNVCTQLLALSFV